jgi:hypothetical protein
MISTMAGRLKVAGASFLILGLVWQHIQATRLGYEVEKSRREAQRLRGRIGALQMSLQTSQSPAQLAANARVRLGMFPAAPDSLRFLDAPAADAAPRTFLARLLSLVARDA